MREKGLAYKEVPGAKLDMEIFECNLKDEGEWLRSKVVQGNSVNMKFNGVGNCKDINFLIQVRDKDDKKVDTLVGTFDENNVALVPWTAKWDNSIGGKEQKYEMEPYFFNINYRTGIFKWVFFEKIEVVQDN